MPQLARVAAQSESRRFDPVCRARYRPSGQARSGRAAGRGVSLNYNPGVPRHILGRPSRPYGWRIGDSMPEPARSWGPRIATVEDDFQPIPYHRLVKDPPVREWMVEGCFMRGTVGLIAGDGNIGKSLICQQLATSAVLGRPWLGLTLVAGRALYFGCEDDEGELHRRQWAINKDLGYAMADVLDAGLDLRDRVGKDN